MFTVYCLTNKINGKKYVGKTGNLCQRMREHRHGVRHRVRKSEHLYHSIRKYGWQNFELSVLAETLDEVKVDLLEIGFIQQFGSWDPERGYNLTLGGDGVHPTPSWRQTLSEKARARNLAGPRNPFFGKKHTPETRVLMSGPRENTRGPNHRLWGKKQSAEVRAKIRVAKLGKVAWTPEQRQEIGRRGMGEKSSTAKLTNAQAVEIRSKHAEGVPAKELQVQYGLSKSSVWKVIRHQTYREVG